MGLDGLAMHDRLWGFGAAVAVGEPTPTVPRSLVSLREAGVEVLLDQFMPTGLTVHVNYSNNGVMHLNVAHDFIPHSIALCLALSIVLMHLGVWGSIDPEMEGYQSCDSAGC